MSTGMSTGTKTHAARFILAACLLFAMAGLAAAQTAKGDPTDVAFESMNATTREPGTVSR